MRGRVGGRSKREGLACTYSRFTDYVHIADSLHCPAETNTTCKAIILQLKKHGITKAPNLIQSQLLLPPCGERPAASKKPPEPGGEKREATVLPSPLCPAMLPPPLANCFLPTSHPLPELRREERKARQERQGHS